MAGSSSASSCDITELDCSVCHQQFTDPKILHCLHSFCKNCICLHESDGPTKVAVCPICSRKTKVDCIDVLKSSSHLVERLKGFRIQEQVMKSPQTKLACGSCSLKKCKVAARCLDCSMYLCLNCKMVHRRITALSQHRVVSLDDLRSGKGLKTPRKETAYVDCTKHPGEKLKFFCQTCKKWVCRDCRVAEHGSQKLFKGSTLHEVEDTDLLNSVWRSWTKKNTSSLEKAVTQFQSTLEIITKAGPVFNNHAAILVEDVKEVANNIRKVIETEETHLIEEIGRKRQEQEETLKGCTKKVNSAIGEIKHAIETANEVADVPSDDDFFNLLPIIKEELSRLLKRKPSSFYTGLPLMTLQKQRGVGLRLGHVEMSSRVTLPPPERRAKQANPEGSSETSVPANFWGSSKTSVPANPESSPKTSVPANPGGPSKTSVPAKPGGSSKTSVSAKPGGSSKTSVPAKPGGSSKTSDQTKPGGSSKTSVPAKPGGSSKTSVPAKPGGSSKTSVPAKPGGSSKTSVPAKPGGSSKTSDQANPGGSSETSVLANPRVVLKCETYPELPGAKRKQITSKEATEQGDDSRKVFKRCKTEL